jgi:hypothetical protein
MSFDSEDFTPEEIAKAKYELKKRNEEEEIWKLSEESFYQLYSTSFDALKKYKYDYDLF